MRKLLRDGGWEEAHLLRKEADLQPNGLRARNGVWNVSKPVREGHGRSLIQPPHLNARGVWNMRKLLRDEKVEREGGFYGGKERTHSQTETRIQTPGLGARNGVWNVSKPVSGGSLIQPPDLKRGSGT